MGILCFSDSESVVKPVLWSLYADKHHGVAFELKRAWNDNEFIRMTYSEERPVLDFNRLREIRDEEARRAYLLPLVDRLPRQKSSGWCFEREYRLSIDINDRKHCELAADGRHYWRIPNDALQRVVLGFRCPLEEHLVRRLLDMNGFADTKIVRAEMRPETYAISS